MYTLSAEVSIENYKVLPTTTWWNFDNNEIQGTWYVNIFSEKVTESEKIALLKCMKTKGNYSLDSQINSWNQMSHNLYLKGIELGRMVTDAS